MDGYTVDEAAEVLGIPGTRVWELITSGVLAASSEGRSGMRVFLQPRTTTDMESVGSGEPRGSEATPFRELLTEFRNLTERYGQALLALGEARGEVASLRGRVELLEARMDVRHAPARIAPVGSWPSAETLVHDEDEASLDEIAGLAPPAAEQEIGRDDASPEEVFAAEVSAEESPAAEQGIGLEEVSAAESPAAEQFLEIEAETPRVDGGVGADSLAVPPPEETNGHARRRGRSRAAHPNLADIPAALARAEDPTAPEVRPAHADGAAVAEPEEMAPSAAAEPEEQAPAAVAEPDEIVVAAAEPEEMAPAAVAAPPDDQQVAGEEAPIAEDAGAVPDEETSEADAPLYDAASPYTTAFEEPDWIIDEDLWRSVGQAGSPQEAPTDASAATDSPAEPEIDEPSWISTPQPEPAPESSIAQAGEEAEPSVGVVAEAEAEPEPEPDVELSATSGPDGGQKPPAIEAIMADVAFSIGEPEPEGSQPAEEGPEGEDAEPPGDFDAFMAAADLGSPPPSEPDYAAELEHSTAGWHSAIAPTEGIIDVQDAAPPVDPEEPAPAADETPSPTTDPSDDAITDSWDASEMEAIRALLARANAIDREQLEVEASSRPFEPDEEESVREIVASGATGEPDMPALPDGEELIADLAGPDAGPDEPPFSLAPHLELPGSDDLGEAMAALEAIASEEAPQSPPSDRPASARSAPLWPEAERRVWSGATAEPWTTPVPTIEPEPTIEPATAGVPGEEVLAHLDFGAPSSYAPPPMTQGRSEPAAPPSGPGDDAGWSESRDSAAGRAFRRLRRIFPG